MHDTSYKSALARRACRYSDARPPRKTDGVLLESEIPPHMRGKDVQPCRFCVGIGITPAYAGKSRGRWQWTTNRRDHPRICREKESGLNGKGRTLGSPPHMRGKGSERYAVQRQYGITPAYAGKSSIGGSPRSQHWDHPRMCGEKEMLYRTKAGKWGSPSHMRGKANLECHRIVFDRITPAYAGKMPPQSPPSGQSRDHPRICGEKSVSKVETKLMPGLPPHMQEKGLRDVLVPKPLGITPAYAGKRRLKSRKA